MFGSTPGKASNQQMNLTSDRVSTLLPFIPSEEAYEMGFTFYYSTGAAMDDATQLANNNALSTKVHVVKIRSLCPLGHNPRLLKFCL
jgi:hypothetical protein